MIDISKELFSCPVYPGDAAPKQVRVKSYAAGDGYQLSELLISAHAGTHVDAPLHFVRDGADASQILLDTCYGPCTVIDLCGIAGAQQLAGVLAGERPARLLIGGMLGIDAQAARLLVECGVRLIGTERLSVSCDGQTEEVHRILLAAGVVILENLDLSLAAPGRYTLCALPLKLGDVEGAPCRAVLL